MVWLVFTIVLAIAGGVGLATRVSASDAGARTAGGMTALAALAGIVIAFFVGGIKIVDAGHVGVVKSFSRYSDVVPPGWHFMAPWRDVSEQNVRLVKETFDMSGRDSAVSKESQAIGLKLKVNYRVNGQRSQLLRLYNNVGSGWKDVLLEGRVPQDTKAITAEFSTGAITANRETIRERVRTALRRELRRWGVNIEDVQLANIGFPASFERAINAKQIQTQKALQARAKVAQAQAEADQAVARAKGFATSTLVKARAQASANKLIAQSLTDRVIAQHTIDKLGDKVQVIVTDGKSPVVLGGSNAVAAADDVTATGK